MLCICKSFEKLQGSILWAACLLFAHEFFDVIKSTLFLFCNVKRELRLRIHSVIEDKIYERYGVNIPKLSIVNPGNTQN